ncbi:MAG: glycosyltransferase family 4 protein [Herpetosiphonaceae bacterium]|nr:glycosyltransferase family 4 protein [Herpetosiphonaceae bacterium]
MKIVQVCRQFYPGVGGIESVTLGLSQALQEHGHRSDVITLRKLFSLGMVANPTEWVDGINVYRLPHVGIRRYPVAPAVLSLLAPYDIIHIHAIDFFTDFLTATRRIHRKPIVVMTHGGFFHTRRFLLFKHLYFRTITRLSLSGANAIICDSPHDYNLFQHIVPPHKLYTCAIGVNVQPYINIQKQIEPGLLVGIGRIVENKRIERLIQLLPALALHLPDVHLVWIGDDEQGRLAHLLTYAQELGVASRVQFLGKTSEMQMQEQLRRAHLYVSSASYEAFGISTIEAMSSATVPVVTPTGIHPEVVHDGRTGFICTFEDHRSVDCLRHALTLSSASLDNIGQNARVEAARYSWTPVVKSYLDVYDSILTPKNRMSWS